MRIAGALIALAVAGGIATVWAQAPAPTFKRTVLQQFDLSVPGREAVTALVEFQPGGTSGRHTHPGEEIGYVLEGTFVFEQDGKPPVTLKAGGTFFIPAGTIHNATNQGGGGKVLANYVVEKGKPLGTPAPAK
jgi:quercetin dioxygenase-like cupin family protein